MSPVVPALTLDRVSYAYGDAGARALDDVRLTVQPGEFVVLAGASGSGKSTLLHAACGLVPHHRGGTLYGHVTVAGRDTREAGPAALAAVVGTVLQDPETQVVLNTVRAELSLPLQLRGHAPATVALAVEEVALALGIEALLDRATHELSGGELQRVALGAALSPGGARSTEAGGGVQLFLLDEPTAQLDPVAGDELVWLLRRLNEEHGTAVLLAEHRLDRCLHHADRVVALDAGRVVCDAPPRDFLAWAADAAPGLLTPAARLFRAGGRTPLPVAVKDARAALRRQPATGSAPPSDAAAAAVAPDPPAAPAPPRRRFGRRPAEPEAAIAARGIWREIPDGPTVLRGIDLRVAPGERIALMGRNGAGKSSLLRVLAGLDAPTRGRIERAGRFGLLPQHPGDVLLHDRVGDEAPAAALQRVGLAERVDRHPRDLSGGERQRLALAVVLGGAERPAAIGLDEPTRGMDHAARAALHAQARGLADDGVGVVIATHDVEFAAAFADRVVLLAQGRVIADGPPAALLGGGWYFATQTARILDRPGVLTPEQGGPLLAAPSGADAHPAASPADTAGPAPSGEDPPSTAAPRDAADPAPAPSDPPREAAR